MRRRLATALSAGLATVAAIAAGLVAIGPAGADVPAGLTITDTSRCDDGNPFVGVKVVNADPANPVALQLQYGFDGGSMGSPSDFVVVTDNQSAAYTDAGGTARLLLTDEQGATVYDTGFVDPCATTEPAVWLEHDCTDTEMTMWVEIRNLPAGQAVWVERQEGGAFSGNAVTTEPSTWPVTLDPMEVGRIQVELDGATIFDSGERYLTEEGSCNEDVPPLEDGASVSLSSTCIEAGARFVLAIEGDGDELTHSWSFGEDGPAPVTGTGVFGSGAEVTQDAPLGSSVRVEVRDAWSRQLLGEGPLAVTGEGACTAAPLAAVAPVVAFECEQGQPVALVGARNDGNVTTDASVSWTVADGPQQSSDAEDQFAAILPGEVRTASVPVAPGDTVEVTTSLSGGGKDGDLDSSATSDVAPSGCEVAAPEAPEEPTAPAGPVAPAEQLPPASPLPAPADPAVVPAVVAGTQAAQGTLPRTGGDVVGRVTVALGLLALGAGLRSRARRS